MAPKDVPEAYELTQWLFHLADKYRMPCILLTDGMLARTQVSVDLASIEFEPLPPKDWAVDGTGTGSGRSKTHWTWAEGKVNNPGPGPQRHWSNLAELAYADFICRELVANELVGERARGQLLYHASVTREPAPGQPRLTELLAGGRLVKDLGLGPLDPAADRLMMCGSMGMLDDMRAILSERGFTEGSHVGAGEFVYEKAFVG